MRKRLIYLLPILLTGLLIYNLMYVPVESVNGESGETENSQSPRNNDLLITKARILDVENREIRQNQNILISDGNIREIQKGAIETSPEIKKIDAEGRLVTSGLIDVHGHLSCVLGDSVSRGGGYITHLDNSPDSLKAYKQRYADAYMPHGVTTVRDAGSTEKDIKLLADWYKKPSPELPDFYPSGGALISPHERRQNAISGTCGG